MRARPLRRVRPAPPAAQRPPCATRNRRPRRWRRTARPRLPKPAPRAAAATFEKYCSDCHTGARAKANIDFDKLTERMTPAASREKADTWDDVVLMLESRDMPPPDDADDFPTDAERAADSRLDPHRARRVRRAARRRPRTGHRPPPDQRRVRLRDPRSHRRRHQDRHRRLERFGRRRGLRQLRRRPVGAGHHRRALPRRRQADRRPRRDRLRPARLPHRRRRERPRAVGPRPDQPALREQGLPRRVGRRRPAIRLRALRQGALRHVALQAPRGAGRSVGDPPRPRREGRHHRPLRRSHVGRRQPHRHRLPERRHDRRLAEILGADRPTSRRRLPRRGKKPTR